MLAQRGRIVLSLPATEWRCELLQPGSGKSRWTAASASAPPNWKTCIVTRLTVFIVATSLQQQATLITADENLLTWPSELVRQDARP